MSNKSFWSNSAENSRERADKPETAGRFPAFIFAGYPPGITGVVPFMTLYLGQESCSLSSSSRAVSAQRSGGDRCAAGQIPHPRRAGLKPERREFGMTIGMVGGVEAAISPFAPWPPRILADRSERH